MRQQGTGQSTETFRAVAMVLVVGLVGWGTVTRSPGLDSAARFCMLAGAVAVLCSAVFLYVQWHVGQEPAMAWAVTVTAAYAVQLLNWFVLIANEPGAAAADTAWAGFFQVTVTAALGYLLVRGDRMPVRRDPLAVGLGIGLAIIVLRVLVFAIPMPDPSPGAYATAVSGLVIVGLWVGVRILRSAILTPELRWCLGLSAALFGLGRSATITDHAPTWILFLSIATNTAGAALLLGTAVALARSAVLDESAAVGVLQRRLEAVELDLHTDHEKLHEIRSTLAGISTATELLHRSGISPARREQLHDMTAAELRRLQRLVTRRASGATAAVELDEALEPIVVRHRTEGLPVLWDPSGHVALARSDDVAEIVNVLLANARRHAGGGPVTVDVSQVDGRVELAVSDNGPGIAPAVRARLFQWGARRVGSPGEGIGLAAARLLAASLGGHLRLESGAGPGATFVLSLTSAPAMQPVLNDAVS